MSKPYIVCEDYNPDVRGRKIIKRFKHEKEAISFVGNEKNIQQYNGMTLYREGSSGSMHMLDDYGSWEVVNESYFP